MCEKLTVFPYGEHINGMAIYFSL